MPPQPHHGPHAVVMPFERRDRTPEDVYRCCLRLGRGLTGVVLLTRHGCRPAARHTQGGDGSGSRGAGDVRSPARSAARPATGSYEVGGGGAQFLSPVIRRGEARTPTRDDLLQPLTRITTAASSGGKSQVATSSPARSTCASTQRLLCSIYLILRRKYERNRAERCAGAARTTGPAARAACERGLCAGAGSEGGGGSRG